MTASVLANVEATISPSSSSRISWLAGCPGPSPYTLRPRPASASTPMPSRVSIQPAGSGVAMLVPAATTPNSVPLRPASGPVSVPSGTYCRAPAQRVIPRLGKEVEPPGSGPCGNCRQRRFAGPRAALAGSSSAVLRMVRMNSARRHAVILKRIITSGIKQ